MMNRLDRGTGRCELVETTRLDPSVNRSLKMVSPYLGKKLSQCHKGELVETLGYPSSLT